MLTVCAILGVASLSLTSCSLSDVKDKIKDIFEEDDQVVDDTEVDAGTNAYYIPPNVILKKNLK